MKNPIVNHHRRSIRLQGWDYSFPGYYFLTLCIHDRWLRMFGDIVDGKMILNDCGAIIREWIEKIPGRYKGTIVDAFVVMPNHVHLIIRILSKPITESMVPPVVTPVGAIHELPLRGCQWGINSKNDSETYRKNRRIMTIPKIIGYYRMNTAKRINAIRMTSGTPVWQRNYWEHIIRDEVELFKIRRYIKNNPVNWEADRLNAE